MLALQTVAPASVTSLARPLPQQRVDKGKVWLIVVTGAVSLFGATVLLENNEALFPAIARANKAMAAAQREKEACIPLQPVWHQPLSFIMLIMLIMSLQEMMDGACP